MNIRMDSDVKKQAERLFAEIGINMTTAINIFLRQSIRQQGIPFELRLGVPNAETVSALEEAEKILKNRDTTKYASVESLFDELDN
jgi:DNA-damage-inducible protein J